MDPVLYSLVGYIVGSLITILLIGVLPKGDGKEYRWALNDYQEALDAYHRALSDLHGLQK